MGRLEAHYYINDGDKPQVTSYLERKGGEISRAASRTSGIAEGRYIGELRDRWNEALCNVGKGGLFRFKVNKRSINALECERRDVDMLSDGANPIKRRHWTAGIFGASDDVSISVYGQSISGIGVNPLTVRMSFSTYGIAAPLSMSKRSTFHSGPEGEVSVTKGVEAERDDYRAIMLETTVGELHTWQDLFGDLQEVAGPPTRVTVYDSDEFDIDIHAGVAVEVGSDERGINSNVALEQAEKIQNNCTFRKD
jgi:hypothetical protein